MVEKDNIRCVSCPSCGKQLFKVTGNCSIEIRCTRCKKEIVGIIDDVYMKIYQN